MAQDTNYEKQPIAAAVQTASRPNELHVDLLSINGVNPFDGMDSAGRKQMLSSHLGQRLTIKGATERRIQTGMENEFGKYTMAVKMPVNGEIIKVIDRYRQTHGAGGIQMNPQTIAIFEDLDSNQFDIMNIENYCSHHQYFGFKYIFRKEMYNIRPGAFIKKDTIIADSPAIDEKTGAYKLGIELNMALMTVPAAAEDGIIICRDVLPSLAFKTYETRVVEFGSRMFPLNLMGNDEHFQAYPNIGETIKADGDGRGMLMCLRPYDKNLAVVDMSVRGLQKIDFAFGDRPVYAGAGGRIVDIKIHHDNNVSPSPTPVGMEVQSLRYDEARRHFYQEIYNEYDRLRRSARDRGRELKLSPRFHHLVVEAISVVGKDDGQKVFKLYRQSPLDDFRIEFVIEYDIIPTIGFKLTDFHGGKGVICEIWDPEQMPIDAEGNRADIIMDPNSRVSRMNLGGPMEMFVNGSSRDTSKRVMKLVQWDGTPLAARDPMMIDAAWDYLMGYYAAVSPKMHAFFTSGRYTLTKTEHLTAVCKNGIYLFYPPDNPAESEDIVAALEAHYPSCYGPVTYIGRSGRKITTRVPVRIASCYFMLLEKIGDDLTAVSSGKTQHFGVLAQVTNSDKYTSPTRNQAIRALGEAELRIYVSYVGARMTADIHDRSNNPATHEHMLFNLLRADKPTDLRCIVDRTEVPLGGSKPLLLINHIGECAGWGFEYHPYDDRRPESLL